MEIEGQAAREEAARLEEKRKELLKRWLAIEARAQGGRRAFGRTQAREEAGKKRIEIEEELIEEGKLRARERDYKRRHGIVVLEDSDESLTKEQMRWKVENELELGTMAALKNQREQLSMRANMNLLARHCGKGAGGDLRELRRKVQDFRMEVLLDKGFEFESLSAVDSFEVAGPNQFRKRNFKGERPRMERDSEAVDYEQTVRYKAEWEPCMEKTWRMDEEERYGLKKNPPEAFKYYEGKAKKIDRVSIRIGDAKRHWLRADKAQDPRNDKTLIADRRKYQVEWKEVERKKKWYQTDKALNCMSKEHRVRLTAASLCVHATLGKAILKSMEKELHRGEMRKMEIPLELMAKNPTVRRRLQKKLRQAVAKLFSTVEPEKTKWSTMMLKIEAEMRKAMRVTLKKCYQEVAEQTAWYGEIDQPKRRKQGCLKNPYAEVIER
jgi:hypothetical protein